MPLYLAPRTSGSRGSGEGFTVDGSGIAILSPIPTELDCLELEVVCSSTVRVTQPCGNGGRRATARSKKALALARSIAKLGGWVYTSQKDFEGI